MLQTTWLYEDHIAEYFFMRLTPSVSTWDLPQVWNLLVEFNPIVIVPWTLNTLLHLTVVSTPQGEGREWRLCKAAKCRHRASGFYPALLNFLSFNIYQLEYCQFYKWKWNDHKSFSGYVIVGGKGWFCLEACQPGVSFIPGARLQAVTRPDRCGC